MGKDLGNSGRRVLYKMDRLCSSCPSLLSLPPMLWAPPCRPPAHHPQPCCVLSPVPKLPIQVRAPRPEDSDSSSDSDYEHYDFSAQPPVALTTFYSECRAGLLGAHLPAAGGRPS